MDRVILNPRNKIILPCMPFLVCLQIEIYKQCRDSPIVQSRALQDTVDTDDEIVRSTKSENFAAIVCHHVVLPSVCFDLTSSDNCAVAV